jgi:16S rRNA (uracil1498-N3)-methyltransferase
VAGEPRLFLAHAVPGPGAEVALEPAQAHYLGRVLRLGPGGVVRVFNGRDGEWRCRIVALAKAGGRLEADRRTREQAEDAGDGPWLCFAPLKRGPVDLIAGKATELGASRLVPVATRFTDAQRVNTDRLALLAAEAAEQCGRLTVPEVAPPVALPRLLDGWPAERALVVAAEAGDGRRPVLSVAAALAGRPAALMIGPEGGFAVEELDGLGKLPFVHRCHLGPRILRAETAAIALLACWQAGAGDAAATPSRPLTAG